MNSPDKEDIEASIKTMKIGYKEEIAPQILFQAYKEAIDVLRDVLASTPYDIDERIDYYTIQVDKPDYHRAKEIIDKYPGE